MLDSSVAVVPFGPYFLNYSSWPSLPTSLCKLPFWDLVQKLVEKLKRERFRAIFDYLGRGESDAQLNLVEVVQVGILFADLSVPSGHILVIPL